MPSNEDQRLGSYFTLPKLRSFAVFDPGCTFRERPFDFYGEGWKIYFSLGILFRPSFILDFYFFVKEDPGFVFSYTFQKLYIKC